MMKRIIATVVLLCATPAYPVSLPGIVLPTPIADRVVEGCLWPILKQNPGNLKTELKARLDSTKQCIETVIMVGMSGEFQ